MHSSHSDGGAVICFQMARPVEVLSFPGSAVVAETLNDFVAFLREIDAKG